MTSPNVVRVELVGVAANTVARRERRERTIQPTTARLIEFVVAQMKAARKEKATCERRSR